MIKSFSQYLDENTLGYLYHGTTVVQASQAIRSNYLKASVSGPAWMGGGEQRLKTVSFTRSAKYAAFFAQRVRNGGSPVVFQVDRQVLASRYTIKTFNYYGYLGVTRGEPRYDEDGIKPDYDSRKHYPLNTQSEEYVVGNKDGEVKYLDRYLLKVIIQPVLYDRLVQGISAYLPETVDTILKHPLLWVDGMGWINKQDIHHPKKVKILRS